MPARRSRPLAAALAGLALGLAALTGCAGTSPEASEPRTGSGLHGTEPDVPVSRPSIVLTDTEGRQWDLVKQTQGRPTLLYFGYTDCPDECPTTMAYVRSALRTSDKEVRDRTVVVFVTTDPERDTAARLRTWLKTYAFGGELVGLRGTPAEVEQAQRLAGARPATQTGPVPTLAGSPSEHQHAPGTPPHSHDRPLGYGVAHATDLFAYDASDRLAVLYPQSMTPADLRADLPALARKE